MLLKKIVNFYLNNGFLKTLKHITNRILSILRNNFVFQNRYILEYENIKASKYFLENRTFRYNLYHSIEEIPQEILPSFFKNMNSFFKRKEHYLNVFNTKNAILLVIKNNDIAHFEFINFNDKHIFPPIKFDTKKYVYIWEVHTVADYRGNNLYIKSLSFLANVISKKLLLTTRITNKIAMKSVKKFGFKRVGFLFYIKFFKKIYWIPLYFKKR